MRKAIARVLRRIAGKLDPPTPVEWVSPSFKATYEHFYGGGK